MLPRPKLSRPMLFDVHKVESARVYGRNLSTWSILCILILLLIPSGVLAWMNCDMPQFGWTHDDGLYFVGAKAWATGAGHRIVSLPGEPWQTKYPPVYPLILAAVWKIWPQFPKNLQLATLVSWLFLPATLWMMYRTLQRYGFGVGAIWAMLAFTALNPYVHVFSTSLLSEFPFTLLLLGTMLALPVSPVLAGVLAGLAYLTRTGGLPLLPVFLFAGQRKRGWVSALTMLPAVAGWMIWCAAHPSGSSDPYTFYYLDYIAYHRYVLDATNPFIMVWKNLDSLLTGIGSYAIPTVGSALEKILAQTIAVGAIVGAYRLARDRPQVRPYALFGAVMCLMLIAWHYPPSVRFVFPIFPLLLAGFAYQLQTVIAAIRTGEQKKAAVVVSAVLASIAGLVVFRNVDFLLRTEPAFYRDQRATRDVVNGCLTDSNLPAGATVLSNKDATIYLMTGRHAIRMNVPKQYWYQGRMADAEREVFRIPEFAERHGLTHFFFTSSVEGDLDAGQQGELISFLSRHPNVKIARRCGNAFLYEYQSH